MAEREQIRESNLSYADYTLPLDLQSKIRGVFPEWDMFSFNEQKRIKTALQAQIDAILKILE